MRMRRVSDREQTWIWEYFGEFRFYGDQTVRRCYSCNRLYWSKHSRPVTDPCGLCNGNQWARNLFPDLVECERCGSTHRLCRHHKDRNCWNNSPDNIEVLCGSCHCREHAPERLIGYRRYMQKRRGRAPGPSFEELYPMLRGSEGE